MKDVLNCTPALIE